MNWKNQLEDLEQEKDWKSAIALMIHVIEENENSVDAYLYMCYMLMNLLVEEKHSASEHDFYAALLKKYFLESYAKFSSNPMFLFYMGKIATLSEWYFDMDIREAQTMMKEAAGLEPENRLYQWGSYSSLDPRMEENRINITSFSQCLLSDNKVIEELESKGSLGLYILNELRFCYMRKL